MDAAASMIEKAIVANPTYAEAYNNLGLSVLLPCVHHVCGIDTCQTGCGINTCQTGCGIVISVYSFI